MASDALGVGRSLAASDSLVERVPSPRSPPVAFGPDVASLARGVGRNVSWSVRPAFAFLRPPRWRSLDANGVGINGAVPEDAGGGISRVPDRAAEPRLGRAALGLSFSPPIPLIPFWLDPYSDAVGVGSEHEETIPEVRGADGGRGNVIPFRSPPARGQRVEDFAERVPWGGEQSGDVLEEQPSGAGLSHDAPALGPQPPDVVDASPSPGNAVSLAGDSCNNEIHSAAIRAAIEGLEIVPYRSRIHGTLVHSSDDDGCGVGLPLDNTHKTKIGQNQPDSAIEPEDPAADGEAGSRGMLGT